MRPEQSPFIQACRREPVPYTPVWYMRQAGRSLPEYRKMREGVSMLDSCMRPDLITEITLQPLRRYDVDAAILFSDIVVPLRAVGIDVDIKTGVGPVVATPVRTSADLERLRPLEPGDVPYVTEAVGMLVAELNDRPLIGFAGGPFTLASYLVEGGRPRTTTRPRRCCTAIRSSGTPCSAGSPTSRSRSCRSRSPPGSQRSSSSIHGSARSVRMTTGTRSCRTLAASSAR